MHDLHFQHNCAGFLDSISEKGGKKKPRIFTDLKYDAATEVGAVFESETV